MTHHDWLQGRGEVSHPDLERALFPSIDLPGADSLYAVDDMLVGASAVARPGSAGSPSEATFISPLKLYAFVNASNEYGYFTQQMSHSYQEGTAPYWHVHFTVGTAIATNTTVSWELVLTQAEINATFPAALSTLQCTYTAPARMPANTHLMTSQVAGTSTGMEASAFVVGRVRRRTDSYTGNDVMLLGVDAHYRRNTLGTSWGA